MSRSAFSSDSSICAVPLTAVQSERRLIYATRRVRARESPATPARHGAPRRSVRLLLRRLFHRGFVFGAVQIAVAVLVGRGETLDELRIRGRLGHRDAPVLVCVERVEREGGLTRLGLGRGL